MKRILILVQFLLLCSISQSAEKTIITSDGTELHMRISGKGVPCLMIIDEEKLNNIWFQKFTNKILEDRFTMIYLYQIKNDETNKTKKKFISKKQLINNIEDIRLKLGIEKWYIINLSFKKSIQTSYLIKYPDSVIETIFIDYLSNFTSGKNYKRLFNGKYKIFGYLKVKRHFSKLDWICII